MTRGFSTVRVSSPMREQSGAPPGELDTGCRYITPYLAQNRDGCKDMLIDIATAERSHLKIIVRARRIVLEASGC